MYTRKEDAAAAEGADEGDGHVRHLHVPAAGQQLLHPLRGRREAGLRVEPHPLHVLCGGRVGVGRRRRVLDLCSIHVMPNNHYYYHIR